PICEGRPLKRLRVRGETAMPSLYMPVQPIWEVSPFSIAIVEYDRSPEDRKIVYVNPAFVKSTGYSTTEAIGKPARLLDGPATDQAAVEEHETVLGKGAAFTWPPQ